MENTTYIDITLFEGSSYLIEAVNNRPHFHNNLIRLNFNPNFFRQRYIVFN